MRREIDPREPPSRPLPPPRQPQPPAQPPADTPVTRAYVSGLAEASLPGAAQLQQYLAWSRDSLPGLRDQVIQRSAVQVDAFVQEMSQARQKLREAELALNRKDVPKKPAPTPGPALPGVGAHPECTSQFDASDLALTGQKAVKQKRFHIPFVFPEVFLDAGQKWRFGQKLEYRQEWRHEGFTLGELVSSLSLLPNEELTLEISSWQRTKSEISETTEQEERERLEREQRRTDEESTTNEAASTEGWSVSATGSVSYGPASASITAGASHNTENRATSAERHIAEATTKASNEVSLKRALKITQTAEAGSESRTTRRIRNENGCHTVTFNFFQVVKLYNVQIRVDNDAPTVMLPGLFPAQYSDGTPVAVPYEAIESFTSPANFLTQYFEVDRDLSDELNGWGLRIRSNSLLSPELAVRQVAEALIVATVYLLKLDPAQHLDALAAMVASYVRQARALRSRAVAEYGPGRGRTEQLATPGMYADSLMGRCTACDEFAEARKYVEVSTGDAERKQIEMNTALAELERQRRERLLKVNKLDPFEPAPILPKT